MNLKVISGIALLNALLLGAAFVTYTREPIEVPTPNEHPLPSLNPAPHQENTALFPPAQDEPRFSTLFGRPPRPAEVRNTAAAPSSPQAAVPTKLVGVIHSDAGAVAIIDVQGKLHRLKAGGSFGEIKVEKIEARNVEIIRNGEREILRLDRSQSGP